MFKIHGDKTGITLHTIWNGTKKMHFMRHLHSLGGTALSVLQRHAKNKTKGNYFKKEADDC
jgi:hypothetical protein